MDCFASLAMTDSLSARHCEERSDEAIHGPAPASAQDLEVEIPPFRILRFDQRNLSCARAALQLLFAQYRPLHRAVQLDPDAALAAVSLREPVPQALPMLPGTLHEIGGHADIDRPALVIGHYVDRWLEVPVHGPKAAPPPSAA